MSTLAPPRVTTVSQHGRIRSDWYGRRQTLRRGRSGAAFAGFEWDRKASTQPSRRLVSNVFALPNRTG
jgi:hypothetical protein